MTQSIGKVSPVFCGKSQHSFNGTVLVKVVQIHFDGSLFGGAEAAVFPVIPQDKILVPVLINVHRMGT